MTTTISEYVNNVPDGITQDSIREVLKTLNTDLGNVNDEITAATTWTTEADADMDTMNNYLDFVHGPDGVIGGDYAFTVGAAAATLTGTGTVIYRIGGVIYYASCPTAVTIEDNAASADIADGKRGAWRIEISKLGVGTTKKAASDQQFTTAEEALLTLASIAPTANTATLGYVCLGDTGAAYNIGTTNLADLTTESYYYERAPRKQCAGLTAALGAASVATAGAATIATGTVDAKRSGLNVAQIAADASVDLDDADTIGDDDYGGWVLVTDLAGTGYYTLAADGVADGVSAMTYASQALVDAAIDDLIDRLPSIFCPVCKITVFNQTGGDFTGGTTHWDAATGDGATTTITDATVGTWDRTATTGWDSHKITPPTLPATITAAVVTTQTMSLESV